MYHFSFHKIVCCSCRKNIVKKYGVIECDPLVVVGVDRTVGYSIFFCFNHTIFHHQYKCSVNLFYSINFSDPAKEEFYCNPFGGMKTRWTCRFYFCFLLVKMITCYLCQSKVLN